MGAEGEAARPSPDVRGEQPSSRPASAPRLSWARGSATEMTLSERFPRNERLRGPEEQLGLVPTKAAAAGAVRVAVEPVGLQGAGPAEATWVSRPDSFVSAHFPDVFQPLLTTSLSSLFGTSCPVSLN